MSRKLEEYRIFIATPGGMDEERHVFRDEIREYNELEGIGRGVYFSPVGWEDTLAGARRPQAIINEDLVTCDYFVLALWDRWGSPPDKEGRYTSGCDEEFHLAVDCLRDARPMKEVVIFFKAVEPRQLSDPGDQLKKVLEFKRELEQGKEHLFSTFDSLSSFRRMVRQHLVSWTHAHEQGSGRRIGVRDAFYDFSYAQGELSSTLLLGEAAQLADSGQLTDAEAILAEAVAANTDPKAINRYGHFLMRLGRIDQAEVIYKWALKLDLPGIHAAKSYGNLGVIYRLRGEMDKAIDMQRQALSISKHTGYLEGVAAAQVRLGSIYQRNGEGRSAESFYRQALKSYEQLGDPRGLAAAYSNLGATLCMLEKFEQAKEAYRTSLGLKERLGDQNGMALEYGNLGRVYVNLEDLELAKGMYRDALELNKALGQQPLAAENYFNLGEIYFRAGDIASAEEALGKSLDIYSDIGNIEMSKKVKSSLADLLELDRSST